MTSITGGDGGDGCGVSVAGMAGAGVLVTVLVGVFVGHLVDDGFGVSEGRPAAVGDENSSIGSDVHVAGTVYIATCAKGVDDGEGASVSVGAAITLLGSAGVSPRQPTNDIATIMKNNQYFPAMILIIPNDALCQADFQLVVQAAVQLVSSKAAAFGHCSAHKVH